MATTHGNPVPLTRDETIEIANALLILVAQTSYTGGNYLPTAHKEYKRLRKRALESIGVRE